MGIEVRKKGQICILDISGEVKLSDVDELDAAFRKMFDGGERRFVFNMLKVPWIDTSGIATTVACHKRCRDGEGVIKLVLDGKTHDLFTMYELHRVFKIFGDVEEALADFAK